MKKHWKKIGAIALAVAMLTAITVPAMAAAEDMSGQGGVIGEFQSVDTPDTPAKDRTITIYKEITAYNPEDCTVNAPAITFNYTITSSTALAGKDIYDDESHHEDGVSAHVLTKQGVGSPTITGTGSGVLALVPGTDTLDSSENGTANRFPLTVSFAGIDFITAGTGAGVYRYQINETTTEATKNASNIKEGTAANTLYMDVYVNGSGDVYGYVLFTNNVAIDAHGTDKNDETAAEAAGKTEGFVGDKADGEKYASEAASIADKYYSFNMEVSKDLVGDTYNATHQFPFTLTLANTNVTANVLPIMTITGNATQTALTAGAIAGTWTPTIADDAVIKYVGIPTGTTVTIKEKNDVAATTYTSKSENADTNAAELDIFTNADSNNAVVNCGATYLAKATENHTAADAGKVLFTNTLKMISPTGVIMRFAPYMLILAAGVVLLVIVRRRRTVED